MRIKNVRYDWQSYKFGTISLCMIMRNEAKRLSRCLDSVVGLVDEIIIVDTGSTDNSIEIAERYGAKVLRDPWQDDFARPRNIGLDHATGDWVLIMDPDEMISREHHHEILWLTRAKDFKAFWITTFNYGNAKGEMDYRYLKTGLDPTGKYNGYTPSTKTRFFKNGLGIRFEGVYHELVDYFLIRNKIPIGKATFPVHHWAHEFSQATYQDKKDMYLRLAYKKVKEWPAHSQARWELAVTQMIYGLRPEAVKSIKEAIKLGYADNKQFFALAKLYYMLNDKPMGNYSFEKGICKLYPNLTHIDPALKSLAKTVEGV